MVCLRLIGHQLHGNRRAGRRDRVKGDGLHIFPGTDQPGLTQNLPIFIQNPQLEPNVISFRVGEPHVGLAAFQYDSPAYPHLECLGVQLLPAQFFRYFRDTGHSRFLKRRRDKFPLCGALCIYQSCGHHRQTQQADYHQNGYSPIFTMFLLRQNDTTLLSLMSGHWLSQCPDIRGQGTDFSCPLTTEAVDYSAAAMLTVMVPILPPSALSARVPPGVTVMVALGAEATSVPTAVATVASLLPKVMVVLS